MHPVTLSSVCRLWRVAALAVPLIWSQIPSSEFRNAEIILAFLERSRPLPVHIRISPCMTPTQRMALRTATQRIRCLHVELECSILMSHFPLLERLDLAISYDAGSREVPCTTASLLDVSRYPKLRELNIIVLMTSLLRAIAPAPSFPPLQVLSIDCDGLPYWVEIVQNCSSTLVSLSLMIRHSDLEVHFALPHLRRLSIADYLPYHARMLRLDTPKLDSLTHLIGLGGALSRAEVPFTILEISDSRHVTDLHVSSINLDITLYPQLRVLTIKDEPRHFDRLRAALVMGIKCCPHLEVIRYSCLTHSSETKHVILGAIEASGRSIILEQLEYTPVLFGRTMREVSILTM
jgi:hypothetical protein